ncbi:hypothetical protein CH063_03059, partial [Colletotrichum higginsianum]
YVTTSVPPIEQVYLVSVCPSARSCIFSQLRPVLTRTRWMVLVPRDTFLARAQCYGSNMPSPNNNNPPLGLRCSRVNRREYTPDDLR